MWKFLLTTEESKSIYDLLSKAYFTTGHLICSQYNSTYCASILNQKPGTNWSILCLFVISEASEIVAEVRRDMINIAYTISSSIILYTERKYHTFSHVRNKRIKIAACNCSYIPL